MKYMLLIGANQDGWEAMGGWSREDVATMVRFMDQLNQELAEAGELVEGNGLGGPRLAKTVQAGPDGEALVTDGVYPESKEVLAGYWVLDVASPERAIEVARRVSACPGPGGSPLNQRVEVHPVVAAPRV